MTKDEALKEIAAARAQGRRANLYYANLAGADLSNTSFLGANLRAACLYMACLRNADLRNTDLCGADLRCADLRGADLTGARNIPSLVAAQTLITPEGELVVWKKCQMGVIVQLLIPSDARRHNATGRKCRAEMAVVLDVIGAEVGFSEHDGTTKYRKGQEVIADNYDPDRWNECSGGIHFFLTREEAEAY